MMLHMTVISITVCVSPIAMTDFAGVEHIIIMKDPFTLTDIVSNLESRNKQVPPHRLDISMIEKMVSFCARCDSRVTSITY